MKPLKPTLQDVAPINHVIEPFTLSQEELARLCRAKFGGVDEAERILGMRKRKLSNYINGIRPIPKDLFMQILEGYDYDY
jgi:hypothetical protein